MTEMNRRKFLAGTMTATTAAAVMGSSGVGVLGAKPAGAAIAAADPRFIGKRHVAVLGGGCGGLSAAHELAERGFSVDVYERYPVAGGKTRSMGLPGSGSGGRPDLPGEHGFRFFPGYYRHVTDTMSRIPYGSNANGVKDNLVFGEQVRFSRQDEQDIILPFKRLYQTTPTDVIDSIVSFIGLGSGLSLTELTYFATRLVEFATSSEARRVGEYDDSTWWDFVKGDQFGPFYGSFVAKAFTRNLVAADSEIASTRTISIQTTRIILANILFSMYEEASRLLNAPTSEAWINPWMTHLQGQGVQWFPNSTVESLEVADGVITGARVRNGSESRTITADVYVLAVPVEQASQLLGPHLRAIDPGFGALDDMLAEWMTGVQYFMRTPQPIINGHASYVDSPWAVTSISQGQFGNRDLSNYGDGTARDIISCDVSNWNAPGILYGKTARECTKEEIFDEVWAQMKQSMDEDGIILDEADIVDRHLDPAIEFGPDGTPVDNAEPLLINTVGLWATRPEANTMVPNLFLASDYVKTNTDLATMEGANEAARRAVNGILDLTRWFGLRARIWNFEEPAIFGPAKLEDAVRYAIGLPHKLADRS